MVLAGVGLACRPGADTRPFPPPAEGPTDGDGPSDALVGAIDAAATGVNHPQLAALLRDHWAARLINSPVGATRLGVHDYDDQLSDQSAAAVQRRRDERDALLRRAEALDVAALNAADAVTLQLFIADLSSAAARDVCRADEWNIGIHANPVSMAVKLHDGFVLDSPRDGDNLVARYEAVATVVDQAIASLRSGSEDGLVASRATLERLLALVERQLSEPVASWAMLQPAVTVASTWPKADAERFASGLHAAVNDSVRPAFVRYRDFLRDVLLPKGRGPEAPGVGHLALGRACYAAQIRHHTTLSLTAEQIHQIGLDEIARIDAEITALGKAALQTPDLPTTLEALRSDPSLYFATSEEVEAAAQASLDAAKAMMPKYFGILPQSDCVVRRVPAFEAPATHIGYYEPPHADGSKPGEYYINVYAPSTRPRYEARVLAVHESIPGHHLQIAIGQELDALPAFRRYGGYSAYVEGWALYTERLAEQMGLYPTDLDRMGMLSFDAWRAGRLVVDTGVHAMGWTRAQAEAFLLEHTALTPENIANEVDRYISWPGQALAYKLGQRTIWRLRGEAEAKLGDAFDVRQFHDVVLGGGPVTLDVLQTRVQDWADAHAK